MTGFKRMIGKVADTDPDKSCYPVAEGIQHIADLAFQSLLQDNGYGALGDFFHRCCAGKS